MSLNTFKCLCKTFVAFEHINNFLREHTPRPNTHKRRWICNISQPQANVYQEEQVKEILVSIIFILHATTST